MAMNYTIYAEKILLEDEWREKALIKVKNGRISTISFGQNDNANYKVAFLTPGVIDNHIHGGDRFYINKADIESMEAWLVNLAKSGVCAIMASPYGSRREIRKALAVIKEVMKRQASGMCGGALLLGAHLEGPFLNRERSGAIAEDTILNPSVEEFDRIAEGYEDIIKEMTVAPEIEEAEELIHYLLSRNIRVLAGHTDCTYSVATQAFSWGVGAICHTFNASRTIHHREPGITAAALSTPEIYCEMIGDLEHLHPGTVRLLLHCKGNKKLMLISDAIKTTNCPDGIYIDDEDIIVEVKGGVSRDMEKGCLCGGGCYSSKSVKKLVTIGIDFKDAVMAASVNPARWLGINILPEIGESVLLEGWNTDFEPEYVFLGDNVYRCKKNEDEQK